MQLSQPGARIVVLDEGAAMPCEHALAHSAYLGIGAHPDDLEIMTWHATACRHRSDEKQFSAVVVTDGAGCPRAGAYSGFSDAEMRQARYDEQLQAARLGRWSALLYLGYSSAQAKASEHAALHTDLEQILRTSRPEVVFTHNIFDAHDTHVAVALRVLEALRSLPAGERPKEVLGCEVWRSLDWLPQEYRRAFDVSASEDVGLRLIAAHESQTGSGKRYDLAAVGRRHAHATFDDAHASAGAGAVELALDMTPLVHDPGLDIQAYADDVLRCFCEQLSSGVRRFL